MKDLPDFIVIGAMKAGTTSLQRYLQSHPDISMCQKELNYFTEGLERGLSLDWYRKHFGDDSKIKGEISPSYTKCHIYPDAAAKIHATVPHAKLIYILREPRARIVSHFSHAIGADTTNRTNAEILNESLDHFVATSQYCRQLEQYLRYFPIEQILLITAEGLRDHRQETLARIFRFVGVDPSFTCDSFKQIHHDSSLKVKRNRLGRLFERFPVLKRTESVAKSIIPQRWHPLVAPLLGSSFRKPLIPEDAQREIARKLLEDTKRLKTLTGYSFTEWDQQRSPQI